jgi:hypothetical protein
MIGFERFDGGLPDSGAGLDHGPTCRGARLGLALACGGVDALNALQLVVPFPVEGSKTSVITFVTEVLVSL